MAEWVVALIGAVIGSIGTLGVEWFHQKYLRRAHAQELDRENYNRLIAEWHKLLDIQLQYPSLPILESLQDKFELDNKNKIIQRTAVYELLFSIFDRYVAVRASLCDEARLGNRTDSVLSWDKWIESFFERESVREHYLLWRNVHFRQETTTFLNPFYEKHTVKLSSPAP